MSITRHGREAEKERDREESLRLAKSFYDQMEADKKRTAEQAKTFLEVNKSITFSPPDEAFFDGSLEAMRAWEEGRRRRQASEKNQATEEAVYRALKKRSDEERTQSPPQAYSIAMDEIRQEGGSANHRKVDRPWHKHRDLVFGILLACGAAIMTIALLLLPVDNRIRVGLLIVMFLLLAFSVALVMHYFGRLALGILLRTLISGFLTGAFGWYVWPKPSPLPDACKLTVKPEIVSRLYGDAFKVPPPGSQFDAAFQYQESFYEWEASIAPECTSPELSLTISNLETDDRNSHAFAERKS